MERKIKFLGASICALAMSTLASCTSESGNLTPPADDTVAPVVNLVKAPEINAYSGGRSLDDIATTYSANVNVNQWHESWDCSKATIDLTQDDINAIKELLKKGQPTTNHLIVPWENYFVQQVYKGQAPDEEYDGMNKHNSAVTRVVGSNQMNHLKAYDGNPYNTVWDPETMTNKPHPYDHINNFNYGDNQNNASCGLHNHKGTTLMTSMPTTGFGPNEQFGYDEAWGSQPKFYNNYIIVEYKGEWYVGFDYEAHKNDQTSDNIGEAYDVERDWNFTDWIVRISPAYHNGQVPSEIPQPYDPDSQNGGDQPTEPENPENPGDNGDDTDTPETPAVPNVKDEVEVNLSVEEHDGYLASHLSIHVRAVTDVEIIIPLREEYYAQADDLAIVQQHYDEYMVHGGPNQLTYEIIPGHVITLNFEYTPTHIRVWTEGIDEETINYLRKTYNDGITFEIWTYVNDVNLKDILKADLNQATIRFLDKTPDLYVNAFMYDPFGSGEIFGDDCTVSIVDDQAGEYQDGVQGWHYNGSNYNELYYKNGLSAD